jgi:hypothetical protein
MFINGVLGILQQPELALPQLASAAKNSSMRDEIACECVRIIRSIFTRKPGTFDTIGKSK